MFSGASSVGSIVDGAFLFILGVSVVMLIFITFLMIYFVIKYNRKKTPRVENIESNTALEIVWTLVPTLLVLVMFYYGWAGFKVMRDVPDGAMEITATGRMWSWLFEYENGKQSNVLKVPLGQPVKLNLRSQDVLHSFFIPAFRVKEDAVPGRENYLWFQPMKEDTYTVFCAEYCGAQHSSMLTTVEVMPIGEFDSWLAAPQDLTGPGAGEQLVLLKGCVACHSSDGTSLIGPSFKGIAGRKEIVVANGVEREVTVDDEYLRHSILEPNAELVKGFEALMPPQEGMISEEELSAIIDYLNTL